MIMVYLKLLVIFCITIIQIQATEDEKKLDKCKYPMNWWHFYTLKLGGGLQFQFCSQFLTYTNFENVWGNKKFKTEDKKECENLIYDKHLKYVVETPSSIEQLTSFCKNNKITTPKNCIDLIDHFNEFCFDIAKFVENVIKTVASDSNMQTFIDYDYKNYKIYYEDWVKIGDPIVKINTCLSEFHKQNFYRQNVNTLEKFVNWSKGKTNITCGCHQALTLQRFLDSNLVERVDTAVLFDRLCMLDHNEATKLNQLTLDKFSVITESKYTSSVKIDKLKTLIFDALKLSDAGWGPVNLKSWDFKEVISFIDYSQKTHEHRFQMVLTGFHYDIAPNDLKNLIKVFNKFGNNEEDNIKCMNELLNNTFSLSEKEKDFSGYQISFDIFKTNKSFFIDTLQKMINLFLAWKTNTEPKTCNYFVNEFSNKITPALYKSNLDTETAKKFLDSVVANKSFDCGILTLTTVPEIITTLEKAIHGKLYWKHVFPLIIVNNYKRSQIDFITKLVEKPETNLSKICNGNYSKNESEKSLKIIFYEYYKNSIEIPISDSCLDEMSLNFLYALISHKNILKRFQRDT